MPDLVKKWREQHPYLSALEDEINADYNSQKYQQEKQNEQYEQQRKEYEQWVQANQYGPYGDERDQAAPRGVSNALSPEMEYRRQTAAGAPNKLTPYQVAMQAEIASLPTAPETRSNAQLRNEARSLDAASRVAKLESNRQGLLLSQDPTKMYNQQFTTGLRDLGKTANSLGAKAATAKEYASTIAAERAATEAWQNYAHFRDNPDFIANSKPDPKVENRVYYSMAHPEEAIEENGAAVNAAAYADEDDKAMYFYLWNTYGHKAADKFYDDYVLNKASAAKAADVQRRAMQEGYNKPFVSSVKSIGTNVISGVGLVDMFFQNIARDFGITNPNRELNYNSLAQMPSLVTDSIREGVMKNLNGQKVDDETVDAAAWTAAWLYQNFMSAADSGVGVVLTALGVPSAATLAIMAGAAGTRAIQDARKRGATDSEALRFGMLSAAAEAAFEKISLDVAVDSLLGSMGKDGVYSIGQAILKALGKENSRNAGTILAQWALNSLTNSFVEGSEELLTTIANDFSDRLIMGDRSEFEQKRQELLAMGVSDKEAARAALKSTINEALQDAAAGAFSGFLMGGGTTFAGQALRPIASTINDRMQLARNLTDYQRGAQQLRQMESELRQVTRDQSPPAAPAVQQRQLTEREQNPLRFAMNKAQNGETVTGNDAKAILNDPQAVQTLRDAGVLADTIRPGAEGRTQIQQAVQALAEQYAEGRRALGISDSFADPLPVAEERTTPPLPRQTAQEQQERASTPPMPQSVQTAQEQQERASTPPLSQNAQNEAQEPTLRVRAQEEQAPQQRETLRIRENEAAEPTRQAPLTIRGANATVEENRQEESYGQGQQTETAAAAGEDDFRSRAETAAEGARRSYLDRIERSSGLGRVLQDLRNYRVVRGAESRASEVSRIRNQAEAGNQRDVSALDYGIANGSAEQSAKELDNATASRVLGRNWDRAVAELARQGVTLKAMTGQLKKEDGTQVRAFFSGDGKNIVVQADHPKLSWNQLLDHEDLHRRIKADENYRKAVEDALLADRKLQAYLPEIIDRYARAYAAADPGLSSDDVIEELLADYRAGFDMLDPLGMNPATARAAKRAAKDIKAVEKERYKTNGGRPAPRDITETFAEGKNSVEPPYRFGTKALEEFEDSLSPKARETYDLFKRLNEISRKGTAVITVGSGKAAHLKRDTIADKSFFAKDWNKYVKNNEEFAATARELVAALPKTVKDFGHFNDDGTVTPTEFEEKFKMNRSFVQRVVDALPKNVVQPVMTIDGHEYRISDKAISGAVGGEEYRQAILAEKRRLYKEGKLPTVSTGALSHDNWGAMGFLATNTKTGASGDFTTFCPQMYFNNGCFYCYRRAALTSGSNNKLTGETVWYSGEILQLRPEDVASLNKKGGLRIQSFGDWQDMYTPMLADMLYDAQMKGLQIKIITKEPSMIETVARLRQQALGLSLYFNLSADYTIERRGESDNRETQKAAPLNAERPFIEQEWFTGEPGEDIGWKRALSVQEANEYRKKYPWVNTRIVATTLKEYIRGLIDPTVDVVTGYHGKIKYQERVSSETGETLIEVEALGDSGMPQFTKDEMTGEWSISRDADGKLLNGKNRYQKALCDAIVERGLQEAYYQKACCITGHCQECQGQCGAYANKMSTKNARNRDPDILRWTYLQMEAHPGAGMENSQLFAENIEDTEGLTQAEDLVDIYDREHGIEPLREKPVEQALEEREKWLKKKDREAAKKAAKAEGKASTEIDTDYLAAVNSGDMETAQKMVDEAAKKAGAMTLPGGKRKPYYHGTVEKFTVFDINKAEDGTFGYGFYFSPMRSKAEGYGDVNTYYLMTDRIATREDHRITPEQILQIRKEYGLETGDDAIEKLASWLESTDDMHVMLSLESAITRNTDVKPAEFLQKFREVFGYDGLRQTNETVLFDNRLIKSADPVTYDDNGKVIPLSQRFNTRNEDTRFSREIRPEVVDRLDKQIKDGNYVIVYHSLYQDKDGNLYSPMAGKKKVGDKWVMTNPYDLNAWYKSDAPENIADLIENGTVKLKDSGGWSFLLKKPEAGGTDVPAALNPWNHASTDALNDQFNAAFARETDEGELVTVECVIPLSEVDPSVAVDPETGKVETKPYEELGMVTDRDVVAKPDSQNKKLKVPTNIPAGTTIKPKDSVGLKMWKAGPVHGQISGKRPVYLSRWIRNTRVLSTAETAKMIAKTLKDENFSGTIPGNVVGLKLRKALENEGVKFGSPTNKGYYAYMAERGYTKSQAEGEPLSGSASIEIDPEVAAQFSPEAIARRQSNRTKGVKGERKVSRVRSNTYEYSGLYNEVEAQMDEADEENYTYDPVSEKKSMNEALGRLKADFDGEVSRLSEADRQWGGSDLDTAMGILHRYRTEGRATGDYGDFWRWSKVIQEKGTKGGQFIQAFAKYTRTGTGAAMKGAKDIHDRFKLNPAQQKQVDAAKKRLMDGIDGDMDGAAQDAMKQAKGQKGSNITASNEELKKAQQQVNRLTNRVKQLRDEKSALQKELLAAQKRNERQDSMTQFLKDKLREKDSQLKETERALKRAQELVDRLGRSTKELEETLRTESRGRKDAERLVREISKLFEKQQNHGEPVENWLNLTGEELARKIAGRFSEPKQRTKTTMQTILSDLVGFAEEHALPDRKKAEGTKRTAIDIITDYLNNRDAYGTAWAAAQSYLRAAYTNDQEKLDALNSFLTATIAYNAEGTDRTMLDAILQSADVLGISEKRILELTSAGATASTIDRIGDELVSQVKERMGADYDESFTQQLKDAVRRHITGIALQESTEEQRLRLGGMTTDAARQLEINLQKLLTQSRGDKNRAAQSVADYLIRELGIPSSDAAIAAERITGAFMDELASRADRKLQQTFAEKKPRTQEQRDRLLDLIRLGGLTNSNVEDAVVDALGIGGMSRERQRELVGAMAQFGETLDAMEADDLDGLKDLIRAQAAVRNTPLSRQTEKALAGETDAQYLREFALAQLDAIAGDFAEMSPGAKISTFQTISHLLNMRTALRNLTSNQVFDLVDSAANNLATIPDMVIGAFTGKRTVGVNKSWLSEMKRAGAKQGAARNALEVRLDVSPDDRQKSKYGTAGRRTNSMAASNAFGRILSHLEEVMGYELNTTDEFHKGSVRGETLESLARFVERGDITQEQANAWAEEEALYRSFQDDTLVGNIMGELKTLLNVIGFGDSGKTNSRGRTIHDFGLGDLVVKYTQVPGALIHRGIEYSPLGYAKMLYDLAIAKDSLVRTQKRGEDVANAQRKLALDIGRATTGSGLITLFAVLAKAGLLRRDDDDKDKNAKAMHAAQGLSGTQLNLTALKRWIEGGDLSLTDGDVLADIGFLEPLDSLMTIATLMANDDDLKLTDIGVKSLDGVWKAISNTSAMQTISNIIQTVQYHDDENDLPLYFQIPIEIASDSISGFVPSPVRQLAQATDTTYRDQYRSKNLNDQIRARVANSIPGLRQTLAPKITPLGEDRKYQKPLLNYLNATLNPGNINVYQGFGVVDELNRVYGETDDAKIWPERNAPYSFTANDEKWTLTPDERTQYQRTRGQTTANAMESVMGTDWYKSMGATDQAEVLNWIGNFSNFVAKKEMLESRGQEYGSTTYNKYYEAWQSGTPIEEVVADKHGKLVKAAEETAAAETIIAEAKIPEASKEEAETMSADAKRLYAAFLQGGVSDSTARNLATSMEGSEASGHEQWRMVYDAAGKEGEKAVTSVMTDDMKRNWDLAKDAGVSMDDYIKVREGFKDLNGNGNKSQDEWNATLDSFTFSSNAAKDKSIKGTLWQILTGSGSTKNNPYDKEAGQKVIDAKAKGGSGSGSYAPARIPTLRIPAAPTVSKPSSGLRIRAMTPAAQAPRSGLRIRAQ